MSDNRHYDIPYGCLFRDVEDHLRKWIDGEMTDKKYAEQMLQLLNRHQKVEIKEAWDKIKPKKVSRKLRLREYLGALFQ